MKTLYKKIQVTKSKYDSALQEMERYLSDKCDFDDYSIFYQSSDGFVLEWNANNAPLSNCLLIIKEKGILTLEDYMDERI